MNYLHIIELLNVMEKKVVHAKLVTYISNNEKKEL